jgi:hypothetical protein
MPPVWRIGSGIAIKPPAPTSKPLGVACSSAEPDLGAERLSLPFAAVFAVWPIAPELVDISHLSEGVAAFREVF